MNELQQIQQQAFNVFGLAHAEDPEMIALKQQAQALHDSIAQPLEEINKKVKIYLASCMPDNVSYKLQLNQEKE